MEDHRLGDALDRMEWRRRKALLFQVLSMSVIGALIVISVRVVPASGPVVLQTVAHGLLIAAMVMLLGVFAAFSWHLGNEVRFPAFSRASMQSVPWRASKSCEHCGKTMALWSSACERCGTSESEPLPTLGTRSLPAPETRPRREMRRLVRLGVLALTASVLLVVLGLAAPLSYLIVWLVVGLALAGEWGGVTLAALGAVCARRFAVSRAGFTPARIPLHRVLHDMPEVGYGEIVWFHLGVGKGKHFVHVLLTDGTFFTLQDWEGIPATALYELAGAYLQATSRARNSARATGAQS